MSGPLADVASQFPALQQELHGRRLSYLDSAATCQRPEAVLSAMGRFYREDNANVHRGVHLLSQRATDAFEAARETLRRWINARSAREVVFTKGCTEAVNLVAQSWGLANLGPGDAVLASTMEHHANLVPWQVAARARGAYIEAIPITDDGALDMDWLAERLARGDVKMVAVKHVCNAIGTVNPVSDVCSLARARGALTMIDGAQSLAHEPVDVQAMGADFFAMSGHKVYGPMGIGALYGREELLQAMPPYQTGGSMIRSVSFEETTWAELPDKFEAGTPNVAGAIGFAAALDWLGSTGLERVAEHERRLAQLAGDRLEAIPGVRVVGRAPKRAGIVSFVADWAHPHDLGTVLDHHGVAVRNGHHCCMPLMRRLGVPATTRASFAAYSTVADVDALVEAVVAARHLFFQSP